MLLLIVGVVALAWFAVSRRGSDSLVVYCAHDLIFAQDVLDEFERRTGIPVVVVGDTEASKSLGLVERLLAEKDHPRCDVFWNNQLQGTSQLARAGLFQPYRGSGWQRMPAGYKDAEGLWTGFAGRLRVWIIHRDKLPVTQEAVSARLESADLSRFALAVPLYGTTLSHCSILWQAWGAEKFAQWHDSLNSRHAQFVPGNATVKNLVAEAVCDLGWTDTDDYFVGRDDGRPVEMLPILVNGKSICIPNTAAIIRGTARLPEAQQLVDFLLSREVELMLARSPARQIPLGPLEDDTLPEDVRPLAAWAADCVPIAEYATAGEECLQWLKREYAP